MGRFSEPRCGRFTPAAAAMIPRADSKPLYATTRRG